MALQFQPPQGAKTKRQQQDENLQHLDSGLQGIAQSWRQYKIQNMQQEMLLKEERRKQAEHDAKYGTGTVQNIQMGKLTSAPPANAGGAEQLFGFEATPPTFTNENPDQEIKRMGTEAYNAETARMKANGSDYYVPSYDANGNVAGFTAAPKGGKLFGGGKPVAAPEDREAAKLKSKLAAEKPKAVGSFNNTIREFDNMINEAKAIRDDSSLSAATGATSFLGRVPGTGAKRVSSRLETLKAKTLLNVLSSMKELSKNGASGFGALSEMEGENIRNSISTLDRGQKKEDFQAGIDRFIKEMEAKKDSLKGTFSSTYGDDPSSASGQAQAAGQSIPSPDDNIVDTQEEYDALPSGAVYIDSNGKKARKR